MTKLLLLILMAGLAHASYVATPCTNCKITSDSHVASPGELAPLTDQLFSNWSGVAGTFIVSNARANQSGFIAGDYATQGITSSFVYSPSAGLLCCTFDTLFRVLDLNESLVVGYDNHGAFLGSLGTLNTNQHPLAITFHGGFTLSANSMFVKIDSGNNILLFQGGRSYFLREAPEPGTLGLGAIGLGLLALGRRRWRMNG